MIVNSAAVYLFIWQYIFFLYSASGSSFFFIMKGLMTIDWWYLYDWCACDICVSGVIVWFVRLLGICELRLVVHLNHAVWLFNFQVLAQENFAKWFLQFHIKTCVYNKFMYTFSVYVAQTGVWDWKWCEASILHMTKVTTIFLH